MRCRPGSKPCSSPFRLDMNPDRGIFVWMTGGLKRKESDTVSKLNIKLARELFLALSAGDCLGATSEFMDTERVVRTYAANKSKGWPFVPVGGGPFNWRPGEGTDDSDGAYAILQGSVDGFDPAKVYDALVAWRRSGPRDIGGTTLSALSSCQPWYAAGEGAWRRNPDNSANGSLMRNGVVPALVNPGDTPGLFRTSLKHAIITHFDPLSVLCCGVHSWLISRAFSGLLKEPNEGAKIWADWLKGETDPDVVRWRETIPEAQFIKALTTFAAADWSIDYDPFRFTGGQGYSLTTLQIAVWAARWAESGKAYSESRIPIQLSRLPFDQTGPNVLGWVAMIGKDSDTYGATAGPLVHVLCEGLPETMTANLEAARKFDDLFGASVDSTATQLERDAEEFDRDTSNDSPEYAAEEAANREEFDRLNVPERHDGDPL